MMDVPFGCLDEPAQDVPFCRLVGVSPQYVGKLRKREILLKGDSYRHWIEAYCTHLRKGNRSSETFLHARTEEARMNVQLKRLRLLQMAEDFTRELQPFLDDWTVAIRTSVLSALESTVAAHAEQGITLDADSMRRSFSVALERAARYPSGIEIADDALSAPSEDSTPDLISSVGEDESRVAAID